MYNNPAVSEDINGNYFKAIELYEQLINEGSPDVEVFSNLAFIYWEFAADFGFRSANNISGEWRDIGLSKYKEVIEKGLMTFPESVELNFLAKYFWHRLVFNDFTQEACEGIIKVYKNDQSLVPYFYLYLFDREKYKPQQKLLLVECDRLPTTKNRYIKSLLTSLIF